MEEDAELRLLEQRKMHAMRKRISESAPQPKREKTDREVVEGVLHDRGDEVLDAAYSFYPNETARLVGEIAAMVKDGRLKGTIPGGELYSIFRQLGFRFSLKTSFRVQDKGKLVELSEKLKRKDGA